MDNGTTPLPPARLRPSARPRGMTSDPYAELKSVQREGWALFAPLETVTIIPAADLVRFAGLQPGQRVLDAGCGTGVVATTAARAGARVWALDLSPLLLEHGKFHALRAAVNICFKEGDVEALPYEDAWFDAVLSQFGHMFAPRPDVALAELLRVLKPGGTLAFSTWPPDGFVGRLFELVGRFLPLPPGVVPPSSWGDRKVVRKRLGAAVTDIVFGRGVMRFPTLSPQHYRSAMEHALGPVVRLVQTLRDQPERLAAFRAEFDALVAGYLEDNTVPQQYLMTRATKNPGRSDLAASSHGSTDPPPAESVG